MLYISGFFLLYQNLCCSEQSNGLYDTVSKKYFEYWGFHFCCVNIFLIIYKLYYSLYKFPISCYITYNLNEKKVLTLF